MIKILIIAGEPSGDNIGADLIKELLLIHSLDSRIGKKNSRKDEELVNKKIVFQGIGGPLMQKQGLISLFKMEDLAVMGLAEIFSSLPKIFSIMRRLVRYIKLWKPDLVITIDSPDFSLRLAKRLRSVDKFVPIIHYVAPSVWAWRPSRAKQMAKFYDHVLALLPFESKYFEKFGLSCDFVGHPVAMQRLPDQKDVYRAMSIMRLDLSKKVITVLPGSRESEIRYMLPIFISTIRQLAERFDDLEFVIPAPFTVSQLVKAKISSSKLNVKVLAEEGMSGEEFKVLKFTLFSLSSFALATSGSVVLELARAGTPMVTAYKCGWMFKTALKRFVRLNSANLINIVADEIVVPEFLFEKCTVGNLCNSITGLIENQELMDNQKHFQSSVINELAGNQGRPSELAAKSILSFLI